MSLQELKRPILLLFYCKRCFEQDDSMDELVDGKSVIFLRLFFSLIFKFE